MYVIHAKNLYFHLFLTTTDHKKAKNKYLFHLDDLLEQNHNKNNYHVDHQLADENNNHNNNILLFFLFIYNFIKNIYLRRRLTSCLL